MATPLMDDAVPLLEAVAEYGGVTAAADVLGRNASGISRKIQRLASDLGVPLLERRGRNVELTAAAEALVQAAPHLHAADEAARMAVADAADPAVGEVRVASTSSPSPPSCCWPSAGGGPPGRRVPGACAKWSRPRARACWRDGRPTS
ncbi:LysR family transcriptional regulator [Nesterenkonia pannonica]|uniref:helix-turn-helix domain-containing protein n=1 Tax=Nesterenkonia pannonica TaxID=1548602 RepID=UPI0021643158|nr:LysR family transcriptional regulator [Nesterenkonia pannonica]